MPEQTYIVRFTRIDSKTDEYEFTTIVDAANLFNSFRGDDSGLYSRITFLEYDYTTRVESMILRLDF